MVLPIPLIRLLFTSPFALFAFPFTSATGLNVLLSVYGLDGLLLDWLA